MENKNHLRLYFRLMRFHQPIGVLLLWFPTAWALWIAYNGSPPFARVVLFTIGVIVMRAAGCVMNDIVDRNLDAHVQRTAQRPLATGEVTLPEAFMLLSILLLMALAILTRLPSVCFLYALFAVSLVVTYPFCKRFLQVPQFILGIVFSMGIPMVFAASGIEHSFKLVSILFLINFFWIVTYDTQYAMVDRPDDLRIGIKSTAILFNQHDTFFIGCFLILIQACWIWLGTVLNYSLIFWTAWLVASIILIYQYRWTSTKGISECFRAFRANRWYGLTLWLGISSHYQWLQWQPSFKAWLALPF